jgi:hypothetical protein
MVRRIIVAIGLVSLLVLAGAAPALAGGWATVTLDRLPDQARAGQALTLGFMVRQHGVTPTNLVQPYLSARHTETGQTVRFDARQEGPVGHFVAEVTFPAAGSWEWEAVPDPFPTPTKLGTLSVLPPQGVQPAQTAQPHSAGIPAPPRTAVSPQVALRAAGGTLLLVALALALVGWRRVPGAPGRLRPARSR